MNPECPERTAMAIADGGRIGSAVSPRGSSECAASSRLAKLRQATSLAPVIILSTFCDLSPCTDGTMFWLPWAE
jgi:hypothetical protein